jgi:phage terminase large subunit-like protein
MTMLRIDVKPLSREQLLQLCDPDFMLALTRSTNGPLPSRARTLGPTWVRFVHERCVMGEGDLFGEPARLTPEQQALFWKLAELEDDGSRRFDFALISKGKGSGKSPELAWVGNIDIASDCCVFKEWAPNGNPRGQARRNASVIVMAASEDQANLIFAEMRASFEVDGAPMRGQALAMSKVIEMTKRKSSAKRIAATPAQADGSKGSTLLVDEVHEMVTEEHERALTVAEAGTGKRTDSLTVWASTAGNDLSTLFGRKVAAGLRGAFGRNELFLYLHADDQIANDPDPDDATVAEGIKQANPLAARGVVSVRKLVGKFRGMPLFRAKRYYWNLWVPTDQSWLPAGAWDACKGELIVDLDLPTWVGADMALKRDSAAVVKIQRRPDGKLQAMSKIWYPDGGLIDQTECDDYLRLIASTHSDLQWIAADEAWWPTLKDLEAEGLPIFRMPQQGRNMVIAYTLTYRAIVDQIIVQDGAPDFADQISSAVPNSTDRGWTLRKGRHKRRIDSAPALAGGMFATTLAPPVKEKPLQKPWVV